jgi:hypothetical protein
MVTDAADVMMSDDEPPCPPGGVSTLSAVDPTAPPCTHTPPSFSISTDAVLVLPEVTKVATSAVTSTGADSSPLAPVEKRASTCTGLR